MEKAPAKFKIDNYRSESNQIMYQIHWLPCITDQKLVSTKVYKIKIVF
jgi:hypothetical protein